MIKVNPKYNVGSNLYSSKNNNESTKSENGLKVVQNPIDLNNQASAIYNRVSFKGTHFEPQNVDKGLELVKMVSDEAIKKFFVFMHHNPDEDATAGALELKRLLEPIGKKVEIFVMQLEDRLSFLDPKGEINVLKNMPNDKEPGTTINAKQLREMFGLPDAIIVTDANDIDGRIDDKFKNAFIRPFIKAEKERLAQNPESSGRFAIVDHHLEAGAESLDGIKPIKVIDTSLESASQLIMQFFDSFGQSITDMDAERIAAAMVADTGINKYIKTPLYYNDSALLADKINMAKIIKKITSLTPDEFKLSLDLQRQVKFSPDNQTVFLIVDENTQKLPYVNRATEHALDEISNMSGPKYSFAIKEIMDDNNNLRHTVSIRSKGDDISIVAKYFGGGGHGESSGFGVSGETTESLTQKLLSMIDALQHYPQTIPNN